MSKLSRSTFLKMIGGGGIALAFGTILGNRVSATPTGGSSILGRSSGNLTEVQDRLVVRKQGNVMIDLDGVGGNIFVGGGDQTTDGDLVLQHRGVPDITNTSTAAIHLDSDMSRIALRDPSFNMRILLDGRNSDLAFFNNSQRATTFINGDQGQVAVGGNGVDGALFGIRRDAAFDNPNQLSNNISSLATFRIDARTGHASLGGNGAGGNLWLFPHGSNLDDIDTNNIHLEGNTGWAAFRTVALYPPGEANNYGLGGSTIRFSGQYGSISMQGDLGLTVGSVNLTQGSVNLTQGSINLTQGDLVIGNADCAEEFEIEESSEAEPGSVMILAEEEGSVRLSKQAYDRKVAGVVSGAGTYKPGLILDKKTSSEGKRIPIALMGKVFCKVDADYAPIERGDLLTTSDTFGHAMKAADPSKAFGATIGKALRSSNSGRDLIPILVSLQ